MREMQKTAKEAEQRAESRVEYWTVSPSGETYAVRLLDGKAVGVCGSLHYTEVTQKNAEEENFDFTDEDVAWILEQECHQVDPAPEVQDDGGLTRELAYELSEAIDPDHQGECWPDPIVWDGRPLKEQAEDLLVLAAQRSTEQTAIMPDDSRIERITKAAKAVREALV